MLYASLPKRLYYATVSLLLLTSIASLRTAMLSFNLQQNNILYIQQTVFVFVVVSVRALYAKYSCISICLVGKHQKNRFQQEGRETR